MDFDTTKHDAETPERIAWRKHLNSFPYKETNCADMRIDYQSPDTPELIHISEKFPVKEHYNGNTDLEKILTLMGYVHNIASKGGNNTSPAIKNTKEIMKAAKIGTLWCRDYATVLSEMLLCMGVKAVPVSCLPFKFDYDRHVGVMAYVNEFEKWVFFDPTFNTYFYDNAPMDVFEIRSAYAHGKAPAFRHIAIQKDWVLTLHGVEYDDYDSWYSDYMLKNIFRFSIPLHSAYGCQNPDSKTVCILPIGYTARNEYDTSNTVYTFDCGCILQS